MKIPAMIVALTLLTLSFGAAWAQAPDARAKRAYKAKCASCHGEDGKGQTEQAKNKFGGSLKDLSDPVVQKEFDDAKLKELINKGTTQTKNGKEMKMPGVPEITGDQLEGLARYVRGLASSK